LLGGLLNALSRNFNHGQRNVRLFEFGKCFAVGGERPVETERLAFVVTGARNADDWQAAKTPLDFYDVKGALETVLGAAGVAGLQIVAVGEWPAYLHPGRAALLFRGTEALGHLGQLHPRIAAQYKFKQPVFVAELDFGALLQAERSASRYQPLPKFPQAQRDVALMIDTTVNYAALEAALYGLRLPELVSVRLFDRYAGKELPTGKHSLALSVIYRLAERTLTDEEVNVAHERVVTTLKAQFGAEIR
jgi:phenylalanyl-tRNA synthetase beta chain